MKPMHFNWIRQFFILGSLRIVLAGAVLFVACDRKDGDKDIDIEVPFNQTALLENLGNNIIVPAYKDFDAAASKLDASIQRLTNSPSEETLNKAIGEFESAYLSYQRVAYYDFGPANDVSFIASVNTYPTDTTKINNQIRSGTANISGASNLDAKGLPALDYLLFSMGSAALLDSLSNSSALQGYLEAVSGDISSVATEVYNKWRADGANYLSDFTSAEGTDQGSSVGQLFNAYNRYMERNLRDGKIGIPNGERSFTKTPLPNLVEAPYRGNMSIALAIEALDAMRATFNGDGGVGFDDYLDHIEKDASQKLSADINEKFDNARSGLNGLTPPLSAAVENNTSGVSDVFEDLQQLVVLLKTDAASLMGILITYQDNDGD